MMDEAHVNLSQLCEWFQRRIVQRGEEGRVNSGLEDWLYYLHITQLVSVVVT